MIKKAYIGVGFKERKLLNVEMNVIKEVLSEKGYTPVLFVDDFTFDSSDEKAMMDASCREIAESELLVVELSSKAIGVGVEVGYAKGLGKRIIYLRKEGAEYSKTIGGLADESVTYQDTADLKKVLEKIIE